MKAESDAPGSTGKETLDSIDLVVEADAEQLDAFYDSDSTSESDLTPRFTPPAPANETHGDDEDEVDPNAIPDAASDEEEKQEEKIISEDAQEAGSSDSPADAEQPSELDANESGAGEKEETA